MEFFLVDVVFITFPRPGLPGCCFLGVFIVVFILGLLMKLRIVVCFFLLLFSLLFIFSSIAIPTCCCGTFFLGLVPAFCEHFLGSIFCGTDNFAGQISLGQRLFFEQKNTKELWGKLFGGTVLPNNTLFGRTPDQGGIFFLASCEPW